MITYRNMSALVSVALVLAACNQPGSPAAAPSDSTQSRGAHETITASTIVTSFDASKWELPEGLAFDADVAYVGMAPTSEVVRIDSKGAKSAFGSLPKVPSGKGFMTGLAVAADHSVYAALVSFTPDVKAGIYRIAKGGGAATLFGSHAEMAFPNGIVVEPSGDLVVTDSASGTLFRISPNGATSKWLSSAELKGDHAFCAPKVADFDIGANGLARAADGSYLIANTDRGTLLRVGVAADGSAKTPEILAGPDCEKLKGADGLVVTDDGDVLIAVNVQNKIVRFSPRTKTLESAWAQGLDFPATLAYGDVSGRKLFATNFAFAAASSNGNPHPALVRFDRGETK